MNQCNIVATRRFFPVKRTLFVHRGYQVMFHYCLNIKDCQNITFQISTNWHFLLFFF